MKNQKKSKSSEKKIAKVVKAAIVKTSKTQKVKEYLVTKKSITPSQALDKFGAYRLAAIIFVLREAGWIIDTNTTAFTDRFGNKGAYAKYILISEPKKAKVTK